MKKRSLLMIIIAIAISSFTTNYVKSSFDFTVKKIENNIIEARFKLINSVNTNAIKKEVLNVKGVQSFFLLIEKDNYYTIKFKENTSLDDIRNIFLSQNSDFDKEFIIVTNKSFYNN